MTICISCGAEITGEPHKCPDPLDGFDADRDEFDAVRDEDLGVDDVSRRRWERAQERSAPDLDQPGALD